MTAKSLFQPITSFWSAALSETTLGHWAWTALMILAAAALALPQIDTISLDVDSNYSYSYAGGISDSVFTVTDIVTIMQSTTADVLPFFEILLSAWLQVVGKSEAAARLLAIYFGLLSLAMVFRLARDFVAPVAGTFAALILLSSAFYAYYFAFVRFYTLVVFLSAAVIWLYLRIVHSRRSPRFGDYALLTLACLASITTHAFGFLLYALLPMYHLVAVRKDRRWWLVAAAALAALLMAAPLLDFMLKQGVAWARGIHELGRDGVAEILNAWLAAYSNDRPLLLGLSALGAILGWRLRLVRANPFWLLFPLLALCIALASELTRVMSVRQMRYLLVASPVVVVFAAGGLYALYRLRKPLALLVFLWVAAGIHFSSAANWVQWIEGRTFSFQHPTWHLVSRHMRLSGEVAPLLSFNVPNVMLVRWTYRAAALKWHYFDRHGYEWNELTWEWFSELVAARASTEPTFWILTQPSRLADGDYEALESAFSEVHYSECERVTFPNETVLTVYRWTSLGCAQPRLQSIYYSALGDFQHYGAGHKAPDKRLLVSGRWRLREDSGFDDWTMFWQLLDADWRSVARHDEPLSTMRDGQLRQFSLDVGDALVGDHRLMVGVYDPQADDRYAGRDNMDWTPDMFLLEEVRLEPAPDD